MKGIEQIWSDSIRERYPNAIEYSCKNCQYFVNLKDSPDFPYCTRKEIITENQSICPNFKPCIEKNDNPSRRDLK